MLKNHISLMHGIKNPDLNLMPKTAVQESSKLPGEVMFILPLLQTHSVTLSADAHMAVLFRPAGFSF